MRIAKLKIHNFKIFKDFKISFPNRVMVIVGNNGCGKSTILEAIHLALTGQFRGRPIKTQLTESLFNREAVQNYLDKKSDLPEIRIEVFFDNFPQDKGNNNVSGDDASGFSFRIFVPEENLQYISELQGKGNMLSLPIEAYDVEWRTFARSNCFPNSRQIPLKSVLINADNFKDGRSSVIQFVDEILGEDEKNDLIASTRTALNSFRNDPALKKINEKIAKNSSLEHVKFSNKDVKSDDWKNFVSPKMDSINIDFCGEGAQRIVKTELVLEKSNDPDKEIVILHEEPECHLSFSNLNELLKKLEQNTDKQMIITTHSSFVANRLNLENLVLLNDGKILTLTQLENKGTFEFFRKRSNYDTLRLVLSKKTILVEGDSDDMVVEKAYKDKYHKLPIADGIDVITCALAGKHFLEMAKALNLHVVYITDNDGEVERKAEEFKEYNESNSTTRVFFPLEKSNEDYGVEFSANTLEPELLRANNLEELNRVFHKNFATDEELIHSMERDKTKYAEMIFDYDNNKGDLKYPKYILDAIEEIKR